MNVALLSLPPISDGYWALIATFLLVLPFIFYRPIRYCLAKKQKKAIRREYPLENAYIALPRKQDWLKKKLWLISVKLGELFYDVRLIIGMWSQRPKRATHYFMEDMKDNVKKMFPSKGCGTTWLIIAVGFIIIAEKLASAQAKSPLEFCALLSIMTAVFKRYARGVRERLQDGTLPNRH
jgi:hypothetical protein